MSPKNKGKFGQGKEPEIPQTDEFLSGMEKLGQALKPHALKLAITGGVIAVIVVGATLWHWVGERSNAAATTAYAKAAAVSQVPIADEAPADAIPDLRGVPTHFKTRQARSEAVLAALAAVAAEGGDSGIHAQASLLRADALFQLGRYDEAIVEYRKYIGADSGLPALTVTAREGLAHSLEAKAVAEDDPKARQSGLEEALRAFEEMQPQENGVGRDEALFHQARILGELGQRDEAAKRFEKILTDFPDTTLKGTIELRLLALNGSAGGGQAAPATPTVPSADDAGDDAAADPGADTAATPPTENAPE